MSLREKKVPGNMATWTGITHRWKHKGSWRFQFSAGCRNLPWQFICSHLLPFCPSNLFNISLCFEAWRQNIPAASSLGHCRQNWKVSQHCSKQRSRLYAAPAVPYKNYLQHFWVCFLFFQSSMHCDSVTLAPIPSAAIYPISEMCWERHSLPASEGLAGV